MRPIVNREALTEKKAYAWLKQQYDGPDVDWQRIETMAGAGVPDVNVCARGVEAWLELKVMRYRRASFRSMVLSFQLRKAQLAWLVRRNRAGGRAWVVATQPRLETDPPIYHPPHHRRFQLRLFRPEDLRAYLVLDGTHEPSVQMTREVVEMLDRWPLLGSLLATPGPQSA